VSSFSIPSFYFFILFSNNVFNKNHSFDDYRYEFHGKKVLQFTL
jgi:hypothetical protein